MSLFNESERRRLFHLTDPRIPDGAVLRLNTELLDLLARIPDVKVTLRTRVKSRARKFFFFHGFLLQSRPSWRTSVGATHFDPAIRRARSHS